MRERVNISEIVDTLESVVRDEYDLDTVYLSDAIWETVDGSEWVIYYSRAAQIVESATDDEREEAYTEAKRGASDTYATLRCNMAYLILESRLTARFA